MILAILHKHFDVTEKLALIPLRDTHHITGCNNIHCGYIISRSTCHIIHHTGLRYQATSIFIRRTVIWIRWNWFELYANNKKNKMSPDSLFLFPFLMYWVHFWMMCGIFLFWMLSFVQIMYIYHKYIRSEIRNRNVYIFNALSCCRFEFR